MKNMKNIKDTVIIGGSILSVLALPTYALSNGTFTKNSESITISNEMRKIIQKSKLKDNEEAFNEAKIIDYYETFNKLMKNCSEISFLPKEEIELPSIEKFQESIKRMSLNVEYLDKKLTEDEISSIKEQILFDYEIVSRYIKENKDKDYNKLYYTILNYRLKESLQKEEISNFELHNIELIQDDKIKYIAINISVNNEPIIIYGNGYLLDIFLNMQSEDKKNYISNMKKLLNKQFDIDLEKQSINDFNAEVEKNKFSSFLIALGITAVAAAVVYKKTQAEEKKYNKK